MDKETNKILIEFIKEKHITKIIEDYKEDLEKYEKLQYIDNNILERIKKMEELIKFDSKHIKHKISKKLLKLEQEYGVNYLAEETSYDSDSDNDDNNNVDMKIKRYYEKKLGCDTYELKSERESIIEYSKARYILLGDEEFNKTDIIERDDFIDDVSYDDI